MSVRLDKVPGPSAEELAQLPSRLPDGLSSVGMGLGSGKMFFKNKSDVGFTYCLYFFLNISFKYNKIGKILYN